MYSTDKAGTTVSVDRPRSERAEEQAAAGPAAPAMGPEERATVPAGTPILVVEDDPRVSRSTVGALEELGYTAIACAGGREALDILAKHREIELVITDVMMQEMSGPEIVRVVDERYPELAVRSEEHTS